MPPGLLSAAPSTAAPSTAALHTSGASPASASSRPTSAIRNRPTSPLHRRTPVAPCDDTPPAIGQTPLLAGLDTWANELAASKVDLSLPSAAHSGTSPTHAPAPLKPVRDRTARTARARLRARVATAVKHSETQFDVDVTRLTHVTAKYVLLDSAAALGTTTGAVGPNSASSASPRISADGLSPTAFVQMRRRISQLTGAPASAAAVRTAGVRDDAVQHAKYMAALRTCLRPHGGPAPAFDDPTAGGETTIAVVDKKGNLRAVPRYAATHAQLRAAKTLPAQTSPKRAPPPPRRQPVDHEDPWSARAVRGVLVAGAVRRGKRDAGSDSESESDDGGGPLNASNGVKSVIAAVSAASAAASARVGGGGPGRRRSRVLEPVSQYILATQATDAEMKRQIMEGGGDTARETTPADNGRQSRTASELPSSSSSRRPSAAGPWPQSLSSAALAVLEMHPIARSPEMVDLLAAEAARLTALAALIKAPTGLGRGKKDKELMDPVRQLCEVATMLRRAPGAAVVKQGEIGTQWCVVVRGAAEVSVAMHNMPTTRVKVAEVGFGQGFGELALVNSTPRAATVMALPPPAHPPNTPYDDDCDTLFLAIDKADYLRLVRTQHQRDIQAKVAFLASVPAMAQAAGIAATSTNATSAPMGQLAGVAAVASWRTWPKGSTLVKEGQPVHEFFFIKRGTVDVFRGVEVVDRGKVVRRNVRVASKGPGEYFGEEWVVRWSVSDYLSQWAHEHTKTARQRLMSISTGVTTPSTATDATAPSSPMAPPTTRELPSFTSRITARAVGGPVEVLAMGIFDAQCRCTNKLPVAEYDAFDSAELKRLYDEGKRAAEWHRTRAAVLRGIGMAPAPRAAGAAAGPVDEVDEEVECGEGSAAT